MAHENCKRESNLPSRREFLWEIGGGLTGIALAAMMAEEAGAAIRNPQPAIRNPQSAIRNPQFRGKVKHVIFIALSGRVEPRGHVRL